MTDDGSEERGFRFRRPSFVRKGRTADLTDVPIGKIEEAGKRGLTFEVDNTRSDGRLTAKINRTIIKGDD